MSVLKTGDGQVRSPNLLDKAGAAGTRIEGMGILSQLEHGVAAPVAKPARHWRPGWRHWAAGALCLAVLAVLAYDTQVLPLPTAPATVTTAPVMPAPMVLPQAAQAATIVNTAGPPLPAASAKTAAARPSAPRKAPPSARPQGARPAAAQGDSDVALLTAMVAHAHRQEGLAKPVRDVVQRRQEDETAELLQRCKQLGLIEGMLCRSRICSGRWDSDPACH
ncbi:hypothetical protein [Janthinobacterium sp. UMAB-56]|uniref:hypothetical protein n=1 Tax=Janthinobacterium sp. UMAB-56 TaxID=1365361 RepID=UPI00214B270D|nr:hypothetical protein [Janthinobacterium sp. UMAB-56]